MRKLLISLTVIALGLGGAYLALSPSAGAHSLTTITGQVGTSGTPDAYSISLGVSSPLAPGVYQLDITDYSTIHNFDLCRGPSCTPGGGPYGTGGNTIKTTDIAGTGPVSWMVNLAPGVYNYQCDAHSSQLRKQFTVAGVTVAKITKVVPKRRLVTVTTNASVIGSGSVEFTATLKKGTTTLATTTKTVATRPATTTLRLTRAAPLPALKPGNYTVQVKAAVVGQNYFKIVTKKIYVY
jgi:hypothetical protein